MINPKEKTPILRQCHLLGLSRSSFYSKNKAVSQLELDLMTEIDKIHLELPFYGARKIQIELCNRGFSAGRGKVRRLMRKMGLEAIYRKPKTSIPKPGNHIFPYLLKDLQIEKANKVWATTGKTAAELIESRSNSDKPNMGLTAWRGSIVRKYDVLIAKNYLKEEEIKDLNEIVTMYQNEEKLLTHAGTVKAEVAKKIAEERYDKFDKKRKIAEAKKADEEDWKELEEIEKRLLNNKDDK